MINALLDFLKILPNSMLLSCQPEIQAEFIFIFGSYSFCDSLAANISPFKFPVLFSDLTSDSNTMIQKGGSFLPLSFSCYSYDGQEYPHTRKPWNGDIFEMWLFGFCTMSLNYFFYVVRFLQILSVGNFFPPCIS